MFWMRWVLNKYFFIFFSSFKIVILLVEFDCVLLGVFLVVLDLLLFFELGMVCGKKKINRDIIRVIVLNMRKLSY